MNNSGISIVLPVKDEEGHITQFCKTLLSAFREEADTVEIIVVDGSTDHTWQLLHDLAEKETFIRPVKQSGTGFSQALGQGLKIASAPWILAMNADGNHQITDAVEMFRARRRGTVLIGSRFVPGGGTEASYLRFLMSRYTSLLTGKLSGSGLRDNYSSFFLIEKEQLSVPVIDASFYGRGEGMLRLVSLLRKRKTRIREHPVVYGARLSGSSKTDLADSLVGYLTEAFRIRRDKPRPSMKLLGRIAPFVPVILLVWMCFSHQDVFSSIAGTSFAIPFVFLCLLVSVFLRVVRFSKVVKGMGWHPERGEIAEDLLASRYWNEMLPVRLGDLIRVERLNQRNGIPVHNIIGMIYWEKFIGISTAIIGLVTLFFYLRVIDPAGIHFLWRAGFLAAIPVAVSWVLWTIVVRFMKRITRLAAEELDLKRVGDEAAEVRTEISGRDWGITFPLKPVVDKVRGFISDLGRWNRFSRPGQILHTVVTSYAIWISVGLSLFFIAEVFGFSVKIPVMMASAFATGITIQFRYLPGGIGQIELTQSAVMGLLGVPLPQAVILASACSISMRLTNVILGLLRNTGVFSGGRPADEV